MQYTQHISIAQFAEHLSNLYDRLEAKAARRYSMQLSMKLKAASALAKPATAVTGSWHAAVKVG